MKKKGFTLVELIAVIVILGIVLSIAFIGISSFIDRFKERQYNNVINAIEDAASKYAFDTGETIVFVEKLITEGYYKVDNDSDELENPKTGEKLNCYIVDMKKQGTYYIANFNFNSKFETENGTCDDSKIKTQLASINIELYNNGVKVNNTSNWIKGNNISLKAKSNSVTIDCSKNECIWTSTSGIKKTGVSEIEVNNNQLLKSKYVFQYNVYSNSEITRYNSNIDIKIDNENPIIHVDDTEITNNDSDSSLKNVEINASDGNGSGISGYYIGSNSNCNTVTYSNNRVLSVSPSNNYTICVKDNVGNIGKSSITIP